MITLFANPVYGVIGLLLFFVLFVGILAWLVMPGAKERFQNYGKIALKDDRDDGKEEQGN